MKSRPHGHPNPDSVRARGMHATNARPPPAVPYRRYPSLSDDGQPYFPRLRRARRTADAAPTVVAANDHGRSPFFLVRAFALLMIVVILVALVATA